MASPDPAGRFEDFDDKAVYEATAAFAAAKATKNFILEFGAHAARVARNLGEEDVLALLKAPRETAKYPIRWINIWDTSDQKAIVKAIGEKYHFSPRLLSLMVYANTLRKAALEHNKKSTDVSIQTTDVEMGVDGGLNASLEKEAGFLLEGEEIELYLTLKDTVHFNSIDQTAEALCIGAHWLHKRPPFQGQQSEKLMPPKHWLWLAICRDNTVLSFHETAAYESAPKEAADVDAVGQWESEQLKSMRANTLSVLLQQSKLGFDQFAKRPLSQSPVRQPLEQFMRRPELAQPPSPTGLGDGDLNKNLAAEGTSLLFYYLFEDYTAAGPLKAAGNILDSITPAVLDSAKRTGKPRGRISDIIPSLHNLSKELRELKHLFDNYKILIDKIMTSTKPSAPGQPSLFGSRTTTWASDLQESGESVTGREDRNVVLTKSAVNRFERLSDRLQGLMLNTIQGYFEEIAALQETYFNLTQQKDSQATARLTRSATLLAKLSVFFLPISFMTSYFSVQITDLYVYWTASTYWYSFAVIASVSFVCLFFFGRVLMFFSDVMDDWSEKVSRLARRALLPRGVFSGDDDDDG